MAAYERLSEPIKKLLEGLRAEHSGFQQADNARRDGKFVRREPVKSDHPIVRVHPVSCFECILANRLNADVWTRSPSKRRSLLILALPGESLD